MTAALGDQTAEHLQKKFRYHHGNLREALLAAANDIVVAGGIESLSLRSLGRATGVSQAAPYAHFQDKDELLAAVAESGFQRLALQMAEDATGSANAQQRVEKLVDSYIRFAVENSHLFRLMFGRELTDMKKYPTLAMTAGKSYALISAALSGRAGANDAENRLLTVAIWSMCHGLTTLIIDGKIDLAQFGSASRSDFVKNVVGFFAPSMQG